MAKTPITIYNGLDANIICFKFWKSRLGINSEGFEQCFLSPFDYENRVLLGVPRDAPLPNDQGFHLFTASIIKEVVEISEGRALILFTSYSMLNEIFNEVRPFIEKQGVQVLKQGNEDRAKLLEVFKKDTSSVLFATDSFWEGVDTPGKALELLILCRLPFRVPTQPVLQARMKNISDNGGNPFFDLSLPDAIMKLKQGFGRLMRRTSDGGVVLILDSRIIKKSYGKYFLNSLPKTQTKISEKQFLLEDIESFLVMLREKTES